MKRDPGVGYFRLFNSLPSLSEVIGLCLFAFFYCFWCGQRGIFPLDQSIVYDGAYRIAIGQLPFRDFVAPHSLIVLYYQAIFFKIFGVNYASYLYAGALLNLFAALFAMRILALLFRRQRVTVYIAGGLTAIWFLPPFGTPFGEQFAFLLYLAAIDILLTALLRADPAQPSGSPKAAILAGGLAGLAFYAKQNVAAFMFPFLFLSPFVLWLPDFRRAGRASWMLTVGALVGLLLPALALTVAAGWSRFADFYLLLPIATAVRRLDAVGSWWDFGSHLGFWWLILVVILAVLWAIRRAFVQAGQGLLQLRTLFTRESVAAWLAIYILVVSWLVQRTMLNSATMAHVYIGVLLALIAGITFDRSATQEIPFKKIFHGIVAIVAAFGIYLGAERRVHESVEGAEFGAALQIPGLEALRWGVPTIIREGELPKTEPGTEVTEANLAELTEYLRAEDRNFFIFPDFTFLYATLLRPSPQPLLFFHRGLTYPIEYDVEIDRWVVQSLISHQVAVIVIEERSFFGTEKRLADFPLLEDFINSNFVETKRIGLFKIYTLRTLDEAVE